MSEVSLHGREFVQPDGGLYFLGRVAPSLPDVALHPLERDSPHVPWSYFSVLDLMHRAGEVAERSRRPWTDCTTGTRGLFLAYDCRGDAFVARPSQSAVGPLRGKGGVDSSAREVRRNQYHDLDGEPPAVVFAEANAVRTLLVRVTVQRRGLRCLRFLPLAPTYAVAQIKHPHAI